MRFLNSAYFYRVEEVKSVRNAIAYLGEKELRRFIILVIISQLAKLKPGELVRLSLVRAKFCELLAERSILGEYADEAFLVGMFSLIDVMLEASMATVMSRLPLADSIKDALVERSGLLASFIDGVIAHERGDERKFIEICDEMGIEGGAMAQDYLQAVKYANGLL